MSLEEIEEWFAGGWVVVRDFLIEWGAGIVEASESSMRTGPAAPPGAVNGTLG